MSTTTTVTMKLINESISTLRQSLSPEASVDLAQDEAYKVSVARWSDYKAPQPGAVVNVATESDVEKTVAWATANGVKFAAQSGGHGFTVTYKIGQGDIIINMRKINSVTIDLEAGTAVIGGGALVKELNTAAHKAGAIVTCGVCNSVGVIGATLGGGFGRLQGKFGLGVDNMLSARVITAEGKAITVSSTENSDLWWALRGAGHNFGIVASLTMKAHAAINEGKQWMGMGVYTPDKILALAEAVNELDWCQGMAVNMFYMHLPPDMKPAIMVSMWYPGPAAPAEKAFAALFSAGPVFQQTEMADSDRANDGGDPLGAKGGLKPVWSASMMKFDPVGLQKSWDLYTSFTSENPQAAGTFYLFEYYSMEVVKKVTDDETAFPHRVAPVHGVICPIYTDSSFTAQAEEFGIKARDILRAASSIPHNEVYVNFSHGDEENEAMYGDAARLEKLRALKKKWDPSGCFSHYNPII